jgi:hypothetical protein
MGWTKKKMISKTKKKRSSNIPNGSDALEVVALSVLREREEKCTTESERE